MMLMDVDGTYKTIVDGVFLTQLIAGVEPSCRIQQQKWWFNASGTHWIFTAGFMVECGRYMCLVGFTHQLLGWRTHCAGFAWAYLVYGFGCN